MTQLPPGQFASDVDGDQHIIFVTNESLDGWKVVVRRGADGALFDRALHEQRVFNPAKVNMIGIGVPANSWATFLHHDEVLVGYRDPDSQFYPC